MIIENRNGYTHDALMLHTAASTTTSYSYLDIDFAHYIIDTRYGRFIYQIFDANLAPSEVE